MQMSKILDALSSNYMKFQLDGTALATRKKYADGSSIIANTVGGQEEAYTSYRKLYPKGFDTEINELLSAYSTVSVWFRKATVPVGASNGDGKQAKVRGARLAPVRKLADGSFMAEYNKLIADLDNKRTAFHAALPRIVAGIQSHGVLGGTFDIDDYPTQDQVAESFKYVLVGPEPLPNSNTLIGLPVSADWIDAIESDLTRQAAERAKFAQQSVVNETLEYVRVMGNNLKNLVEWYDSGEGKGNGKKRRTPIYDSLVGNVKDMVEKMRAFAIPETDAGAALLTLADDIEEKLQVDVITAEDLKENVPLARATAASAFALAEAIEDMDIFM
jgi:Arc/MetJ family transcription regulator